MFESIRKHQRLLQFVLLLLIFPAFAFFGVSGYQKFLGDDDSVATVDGVKISRAEFDQASRQQLERLRQMMGDQADPKLLESPQIRSQILEGLITQHALTNEVVARHVTVTDARLRESISAIPGLLKPDGTFDLERYRTMLTGQGLSEASFEQKMRRDLAMQMLPDVFARSSIASQSVIDELLSLQEQTRVIRELEFRPAQFAANVKPDEAALRKHYDAHIAQWQNAESARIEYVVLSAAGLAQSIPAPKPEEVAAAYEQNKAVFSRPEERRVSHILLTLEAGASPAVVSATRAKATALLDKVRHGGDFAAIAKASSQDPGSAAQGGDVGFFARDKMVKPFADAAFSLKEGDISDLVTSEFGIHIIKLTGIRAGGAQPLEQVRGDVEAGLRRQAATRKFGELAETFTNTVYEQPDSLKAVADKLGLRIESQEAVTRTGAPGSANKPMLSNPKLLSAIFSDESIRTHHNTEAIDVGSNMLVAARIVDYQAASPKPFDAVREEVRAQLTDELSRKAAVDAGAAQLEQIRSGKIRPEGFSAPRPIARRPEKSDKPLPAGAAAAVFGVPAQGLPRWVGVAAGSVGYVIYQIDAVNTPSAQDVSAKREAFAKQFQSALQQQEYMAYLESLKGHAQVSRRLPASSGRAAP